MADFSEWGCCIAEAIGFGKEKFLSAYSINMHSQHEHVAHENVIAATLLEFMKKEKRWNGTAQELLKALGGIVSVDGYGKPKDPYWPKASNILTRRINEIRPNLEALGLSIEFERGEERMISIVFQKTSSISSDRQSELRRFDDDDGDSTIEKT